MAKLQAGEVAALVKRHTANFERLILAEFGELVKSTAFGDAHPEPGTHEAAAVGVPEHVEPGTDETVAPEMPRPEPATDPIGGALGVPAGTMGDGDLCPTCHNLDRPGSCTCLVAKSDPLQGGMSDAAPEAMYKGSLQSGSGDTSGPGAVSGPATAAPPVPMTEGGAESSALALSETSMADGVVNSKTHPGATKDPSKKQPLPTNPKAKLPTGAPKVVQSQDGKAPRPNAPKGVKKAETPVPMAKPPSGKVPGQGAAPVASNTSKPAIKPTSTTKSEQLCKVAPPGFSEETMHKLKAKHGVESAFKIAWAAYGKKHGKAEMREAMEKAEADMAKTAPAMLPKAQAKQHALVDASRAAAPAAAATAPAPKLTHPADTSRANAHAAALGGEFTPKGPVTSGLDLVRPPPGARSSRSPFAKGEVCALCRKAEHAGKCC